MSDTPPSTTDRAVTPVLGIILLLAITVIAVSVVGTGVLASAQDAGETAPQASLTLDAHAATDSIELRHGGGDPLDSADIRLYVDAGGQDYTFEPTAERDSLRVGQAATIDAESGTVEGWGYASGPLNQGLEPGDRVVVRVIDTESQEIVATLTATA